MSASDITAEERAAFWKWQRDWENSAYAPEHVRQSARIAELEDERETDEYPDYDPLPWLPLVGSYTLAAYTAIDGLLVSIAVGRERRRGIRFFHWYNEETQEHHYSERNAEFFVFSTHVYEQHTLVLELTDVPKHLELWWVYTLAAYAAECRLHRPSACEVVQEMSTLLDELIEQDKQEVLGLEDGDPRIPKYDRFTDWDFIYARDSALLYHARFYGDSQSAKQEEGQ